MRLKLDIENKILIPFMILAILPITILGIVSYWNGYQLLFHDRLQSREELLGEALAYIEMIDSRVLEGEVSLADGKEEAETIFRNMKRSNLILLEGDRFLIGDETSLDQSVRKKILESKAAFVDAGNHRYLLRHYDKWNWTLVMSISKSIFLEELIAIQKYTLLLTIIFLVLSMQSIIFIAHHISKPIKYFAEVCRKVELGNLKVKVDLNRGDEIGILASSFNHMIDQMNTSTEKLIEMTKFNEDILKNIDIGIMTTDRGGRLLTLNRSGKEILKRYQDVPIMEELELQTLQTIDRKYSINQMITLNGSGGKTIYIDAGTSLLRKEDGSFYGAICSFNDISERKMIENNLIRVDRLASVGQFAAGLAHEIRNPLTGIKTGIQVIKNREASKCNEDSVELMEGLKDEIDRINNLVTDLLDFSKPKQAVRERADVNKIIRKSLDMAKEGILTKEMQVSVMSEANQNFVYADKGQAEQIFLNIITNAVEAVERCGSLRILTELVQEDGIPWIRIIFEDDGIGMDESLLEKIFNPFFTTKLKGTGLGLVVVSKLIEENNGKIFIESQLNKGTKISVLLPEYRRDRNEE
ncbi:HAMP domain-containing protein [Anoxybacterium hadale]|uniref:HAMP domain-containing protein n=1 Tax=Anoxybacterium hadale TaxID=3408580 RepID=A0ACD1A6W2_9FIRM|nr:HAMP domain-containing protein [Clostridiales bacterium]